MRARFVAECVHLPRERLPSLGGVLIAKLDDALHDLADKSTESFLRAQLSAALSGEDRPRYALAEWNPAQEELVFFDRQWRSPARFSAQGLSEAIAAGRFTILGNGETPRADQGLCAMLTSLHKAPCDG